MRSVFLFRIICFTYEMSKQRICFKPQDFVLVRLRHKQIQRAIYFGTVIDWLWRKWKVCVCQTLNLIAIPRVTLGRPIVLANREQKQYRTWLGFNVFPRLARKFWLVHCVICISCDWPVIISMVLATRQSLFSRKTRWNPQENRPLS